MTAEVEAHRTSTHLVKAPRPEVDAGGNIALKVKVSCPEGCYLGGNAVRIVDQDGDLVKEVELCEFDGTANQTDEFVVKAPIEPAEYAWTAVFPKQDKEGVLHKKSSTPFHTTVKPHSTSIAVWDVPSPIALNDKFKIKVGVKCSAECNLVGKEIRVYGERGRKVATGVLGGVPWPGTSALYWADVELEAPGVETYHTWRVKFHKPDLALPHQDASHRFGLAAARSPEHVVTVEVVDESTRTPIKKAYVLLRPQSGFPYSGHTGESGVARFEVPKAEYELYASKGDEYELFQTSVVIADDATIKAALLVHEKQWWE